MCLDINGILCNLIQKNYDDKIDGSVIQCNSNNIKFIPRPELDRFIYLIATTFDTIFYTCRTKKNAQDILQKLSEISGRLKQIYDVDGENLLHQSHCQKISDTKFKKDVKVVQANIRDKNHNEYPLNEILTINDSPEKFDQSLNNSKR